MIRDITLKSVTLKIPEGYQFENIPKNKTFRTENSSIVYKYTVKQNGNTLTIETLTTVSEPIYPSDHYPAFIQIFDNISSLESQLVTVVKK